MSERRYNEDEVAEIFERAAEAQTVARKQLSAGDASGGMTLAELQDIGKEVGIAPELIARAARVVGIGSAATSRRLLGLPVGVGRTVELGRKLTDEEWDHLVVDLRETFDARGSLRQDGSFRQWTNGNLQALLEPTPTGHRLRLKTFKGGVAASLLAGTAMASAGALGILTSSTGSGNPTAELSVIAISGVVMILLAALRLPRWARLRRKQMDEVAERLAAGEQRELSAGD